MMIEVYRSRINAPAAKQVVPTRATDVQTGINAASDALMNYAIRKREAERSGELIKARKTLLEQQAEQEAALEDDRDFSTMEDRYAESWKNAVTSASSVIQDNDLREGFENESRRSGLIFARGVRSRSTALLKDDALASWEANRIALIDRAARADDPAIMDEYIEQASADLAELERGGIITSVQRVEQTRGLSRTLRTTMARGLIEDDPARAAEMLSQEQAFGLEEGDRLDLVTTARNRAHTIETRARVERQSRLNLAQSVLLSGRDYDGLPELQADLAGTDEGRELAAAIEAGQTIRTILSLPASARPAAAEAARKTTLGTGAGLDGQATIAKLADAATREIEAAAKDEQAFTAAMLGVEISGATPADIPRLRTDTEAALESGSITPAQYEARIKALDTKDATATAKQDREAKAAIKAAEDEFTGIYKDVVKVVKEGGRHPDEARVAQLGAGLGMGELERLIETRDILEDVDSLTPSQTAALAEQRPDLFDNPEEVILWNRIDTALEEKQQAFRTDPIQAAQDTNEDLVAELDPTDAASWNLRLRTSYQIARDEDAPIRFTSKRELTAISDRLERADVDEKLIIATSIVQGMDADAHIALAEIGLEDPTFAHAGHLMASGGADGISTARAILRGQAMRKEGQAPKPDRDIFEEAVQREYGPAFAYTKPEVYARMRDAAMSWYAANAFNEDTSIQSQKNLVAQALQAVSGRVGDRGGVQDLNGVPTMLPSTYTADEIEAQLNDNTFMALGVGSIYGIPDAIRDNPKFNLDTVREEWGSAQLYAIGGGMYKIGIKGRTGVEFLTDSKSPYRNAQGRPIAIIHLDRMMRARPPEAQPDPTTPYDMGAERRRARTGR